MLARIIMQRPRYSHPSVYWMIRPFLDHVNQQGPRLLVSNRLSIRMIFGLSPATAVLGMLQTLRSPSAVWVASISDFCREEEPCQESPAIREGAFDVVRLCTIVKSGCSVAIKIEPFRKLQYLARATLVHEDHTYPIAKVRESAAGAIAVIGS